MDTGKVGSTRFQAHPRTATNAQYAAFATEDGVFVRDIRHSSQQIRRLVAAESSAKPALAISGIDLNRLAVSRNTQILVYNIGTGRRTHRIAGNGRAITSLAWSYHDADALASGTIDGSVCLWSTDQTSGPSHRLDFRCAPCSLIGFCRLDSDLLASSHAGHVAIWSLRRPHKPVKVVSVTSHVATELIWHPTVPGRLLTVYTDCKVRVWDVAASLTAAKSVTRIDDFDPYEDELFGDFEGIKTMPHPILQLQLDAVIGAADWLGDHGVFALLKDSNQVICYSCGVDWEMPHEVWRLDLEGDADAVVVSGLNGTTMLMTVSIGGMQLHRIPSVVLDSVGGPTHTYHANDTDHSQSLTKIFPTDTQEVRQAWRTMIPVPIGHSRPEKANFTRTVDSVKQRQRTDSQRSRLTAVTAIADASSPPLTPPPHLMSASLELPKPRDEDHASPMPFLSPSVPSRRPSPNTLPPIEDSLYLPPVRSVSLDSMRSAATHDSDSDDDAFAAGMRLSSSHVPGGYNVPLPRTCSALFTPNGQLLTIFPTKPPPSPTPEKAPLEDLESERAPRLNSVAKLFPTFGSFAAYTSALDDGSISGTDGSDWLDCGTDRKILNDEAQPSTSFQYQPSRIAKSSPTKPLFSQTTQQHKAIVSLHRFEELLTVHTTAASDYRIFCENGESGNDLCQHNANVAEGCGLYNAADVWRLVGMLLEDVVPLRTLVSSHEQESILLVARQANLTLRSDSAMELGHTAVQEEHQGKLRWADHSLARETLVKQTLGWAERHADIQMLASVTAVLAEAGRKVPAEHPTAFDRTFAKLPTQGHKYSKHYNVNRTSTPTRQPMPVLRTDSIPQGTLSASPTKLRQASQASSRNPSQSSTPFLDSTSGTPPSSFPIFPRQSTKLSVSGSGSASPEHHRSSFSAAAKYYAQSITDKFVAYGTSPPAKKLGSSPGTNELSTSLPAASGSWSKSVSFASTQSDIRDGRFGRSFPGDEDGYDSDKTIDDNSLPRRLAASVDDVIVQLHNEDAFADETSGSSKSLLLPDELAAKAVIWRQYYAEWLRCMGLGMQAAEMDKVTGLTRPPISPPLAFEGVTPSCVSGRPKAICSICSCVVMGAGQLCPSCLHAAHHSCLEEYVASLDGEAYECAAGCGCACAQLPFDSREVLSAEDQASAADPRQREI